ncbi:MAG: M23 family metallopeptidase [Alphaproteobacteria bacterium]|nr:M23 family metallopeptidase [Alphaproteobacteria bacterium]
MKRWLCAVLVAATAFSAAASEPVSLEGRVAQGGLVLGRTQPGAKISLDGRPVRVSADGTFLIGFGRDAGGEAVLHAELPGGGRWSRRLTVEARGFDIQRIDGLPQNMVSPPPALVERIKRENARVGELRRIDSDFAAFAEGFIWPVSGPITGVYGSQRILNGEPRAPHWGIDIAAPTGTPVKAPAAGIVRLAEPDFYLTGGTILLDHGHGLMSGFLHLSAIDVAVGQQVRQGDIIARVGATGRVTGAHLDWRINWFDVRIDPALVAPAQPANTACAPNRFGRAPAC